MKKLILPLILVFSIALISIPTNSYALFDVGVYGGYTFAGKIDSPDINNIDENTGFQYGFIGHLNSSVVPMILSMGIGAFYQYAPMKIEISGSEYDFNKTQYGVDAYIMSELPILIHPYLRAGIAIHEKVEYEIPITGKITNEKNFSSYYFGLGAAFTVFPFIQVFGEYIYNYSTQENDTKIKNNSVNIGARVKF